MLPLGQLLQDPDQVDAGEEVAPAVARVCGRALYDVTGRVHVLRVEDAVGEIQRGEVVSSGDVLHHVLVEELENKRYAVGEDEVLAHVLELVDMVHLEVLQKEEEYGRNGFYDDLLMPVDIQRHLGRLDDVGGSFWW